MSDNGACDVCGRNEADASCAVCGRRVCKRCYDPVRRICIECASSSGIAFGPARSRASLRPLGTALIGIGLILIFMAIRYEGEGEGAIILFPFFFGRVSGLSAVIFTLVFFLFFLANALLPWYILSRGGGIGKSFKVHWRVRSGRKDLDSLEYIITTEVSKELANSIYVEAEGEEVRLKSSSDEDFLRSYTLPEGFDVNEVDYEYEEKYLVVKLKLKRRV